MISIELKSIIIMINIKLQSRDIIKMLINITEENRYKIHRTK